MPLFNAMAHVIIDEELYDKEYVAERTKGLDELRDFVRSYTPAAVEKITGVPAEEIIAAARQYAQAERAAIIYTLAITEHSCGVHNVKLLANLALVCGNFGIENAGANPLRGQNNVQGAGDGGCLPGYFPGETLTNLLTTDIYDPITETPEFKARAVRIEKIAPL